ncbi:MAG: aldo/keto reductase [Chitinophagia bacterium]|nr:aldo/keto reductase [Chitinophagia bacterium]
MEYRRMGRSGLQLSIVSYGSWVTFAQQIGENSADSLMSIAYEHGVNFFDNAEAYAGGRSEEIMGRVLRSKDWDRTSYCVSSKAFFGLHGANNKPTQKGLSRKHLTEACNAALRRLQLDYLDLFFCHRPDPDTTIAEVVWTMNILLQQGKILYWGTSEWSAAEIMEAHRVAEELRLICPVVEQPQYNLFEREKMERDYLPVFEGPGMGTTIWSPLASGLLTGKYNDGVPDGSRLSLENYQWLKERILHDDRLEKVKKLMVVAGELNMSLSALSIGWTLANPNVTTTILGATRDSQLLENLKAVELYHQLTPEVMTEIDQIMQTRPTTEAVL